MKPVGTQKAHWLETRIDRDLVTLLEVPWLASPSEGAFISAGLVKAVNEVAPVAVNGIDIAVGCDSDAGERDCEFPVSTGLVLIRD